jgi:hypothetical protein
MIPGMKYTGTIDDVPDFDYQLYGQTGDVVKACVSKIRQYDGRI